MTVDILADCFVILRLPFPSSIVNMVKLACIAKS